MDRCLRCRRVLRSEKSRSAGYGPTCWKRIREAATAVVLDGFTPAQQARAAELIADGGLVPTSRPGVFRTVSSRGDAVYLTHAAACNCPGGLKGRACGCYHTAAALVLSIATARVAARRYRRAA